MPPLADDTACDATAHVELPHHVRHRVRVLLVPGGGHMSRVLPTGKATRTWGSTPSMLRHCYLGGRARIACWSRLENGQYVIFFVHFTRWISKTNITPRLFYFEFNVVISIKKQSRRHHCKENVWPGGTCSGTGKSVSIKPSIKILFCLINIRFDNVSF